MNVVRRTGRTRRGRLTQRGYAIGALAAVLVSLVVAGSAGADETTESHNDFRTGWDSSEPGLSPTDVASSSFGEIFQTQLPEVAGNPQSGVQSQQIYAQPLVADGYVIVATEENRVYALNPATGAIDWTRDLGPSWPVSTIGCDDLVPDVGVTSTPVYNAATNTLYVLDKTYDGKHSGVTTPRFQLHALNAATGQERAGWPVTIQGTPTDSPGIPFHPEHQLQRPGLLLLDGVIYAGFAAHCNPLQFGPKGMVDGYVAGVSVARAKMTTLWSTQAGYSGAGGGVWQGGGGLVSDGPGSIFVATGNGILGAPTGPGNRPPAALAQSVVHLKVQKNGSLKPVDFFSPTNNTELNRDDTDVASGGPLAIPAGYGTAKYPDLLVQTGKDGRVWLLNRNHLGGVGQGPGHSNDALDVAGPLSGVWGHPAFFGANRGYVYYDSYIGPVYALELGSSRGVPRLSVVGQTVAPPAFGYTSGSPEVTSDGTSASSGLVWVVYSTSDKGLYGSLNAYRAIPVDGVLPLVRSWPIGTAAEFTTVATDAGRVYVTNRTGEVFGFGTIDAQTGASLGGASWNFGQVAVGDTATHDVVLTATRDVTINNIYALAPFSIGSGAPGTPLTLTEGETATFPVDYTPTATGGKEGYLTAVTTDAQDPTVSISVSGVGSTSAPAVVASTGRLSFGRQAAGTIASQTVRITNTGLTSVDVRSIHVPEARSGFSVQGMPAVGSVLEPSTSVTLRVSFAPAKTGAEHASLTVGTSAGSASVTFTATATRGSKHLKITPTSINFGTVRVGRTATRTFELVPTGADNVTVWVLAAPGGPFRAVNPFPSGGGLFPLTPVPVSVRFHPTRAGRFSAVYAFDARDGQGRQTVRLTGVAVG